MTSSIMPMDGAPIRTRVAVVARLIPASAYVIAAAGAALSSLLVMGLMRAMRLAESAGLSSVTAGLAESNLPVLIALYLAIICGVAGVVVAAVRLIVPTKTVSPSIWFFAIGGGLGLIPVALLWQAESVLIQAISPPIRGMVYSASTIEWLLTLTLVAAPVAFILLLAGSVWPVFSRSRPKWVPVVALVAIELVLIVAAVAFQVRTSWLHQVAVAGRM